MGKRNRFRDNMDPAVQAWSRKYPRFPGFAEYARLIRAGKARGMDAENIVYDLAENAAACLPEMIEAFRTETTSAVPSYIMMALDIARIPESVPFLAEVLAEGDP